MKPDLSKPGYLGDRSEEHYGTLHGGNGTLHIADLQVYNVHGDERIRERNDQPFGLDSLVSALLSVEWECSRPAAR